MSCCSASARSCPTTSGTVRYRPEVNHQVVVPISASTSTPTMHHSTMLPPRLRGNAPDGRARRGGGGIGGTAVPMAGEPMGMPMPGGPSSLLRERVRGRGRVQVGAQHRPGALRAHGLEAAGRRPHDRSRRATGGTGRRRRRSGRSRSPPDRRRARAAARTPSPARPGTPAPCGPAIVGSGTGTGTRGSAEPGAQLRELGEERGAVRRARGRVAAGGADDQLVQRRRQARRPARSAPARRRSRAGRRWRSALSPV